MRHRPTFTCLLLTLFACDAARLELPLEPGAAAAPGVSRLSPARGYARTKVVITGQHLLGARVRFGSTPSVEPLESTPDRLVVLVPDDAGAPETDVRVVVTNAAGSAEAGVFSYLGTGRLRLGRALGTVDLRPAFTSALWIPDEDDFFVTSSELPGRMVDYDLPCLGEGLSPTVAGAASPVLVDADTFAVLEERVPGQVSVRLCGDRVERIEDVVETSDDDPTRLLAIDASHRFLAVHDPDFDAVAIIDLSPTPARVVARVQAPEFEFLIGVVAAPDAGFIVGSDEGLRRLSEVDGEWELGPPAAVAGARGVVDAVPGCLLATGATGLVLSLATWPPTLLSTLPDWERTAVLSETCDRVGIADGKQFVTWDVTTPTATIVGGTPIESVGRPGRGANGTFIVPDRGDVQVVAARSGSVVGGTLVGLGVSNPLVHLGKFRDPDSWEVTERPVVDVLLARFGTLRRFDAETLVESAGARQLGTSSQAGHLIANGPAGVVVGSIEEGEVLFVPDSLDAPVTVRTPVAGIYDVFGDPRGHGFPLAVRDDGSTLDVLDPTRIAAGQPLVSVDLGEFVNGLWWRENGDVVIETDTHLKVADGAALQSGTLTWLAEYPMDEPVFNVVEDGDLLVVAAETGLFRIGPETRQFLPFPASEQGAITGRVLVPGGRQLAIAHLLGGEVRFFDIGDEAVVSLPIRLPAISDGVFARDGERLYAIPPTDDRLVIYE